MIYVTYKDEDGETKRRSFQDSRPMNSFIVGLIKKRLQYQYQFGETAAVVFHSRGHENIKKHREAQNKARG